VAEHARQTQTPQGTHAMLVEVAAVEIGIGQDGLARDVVEGDVLGRELWRRGNDQGMAYPLRIRQRPLQRLHAAQRTAHGRRPGVDAEMVGEACVGVHPVFDRDHGKVRAPRLAGGRIGAARTRGAMATAEVVYADDEESVRVERSSGTDDVVPPAEVGQVVRRMAGDVVVAGQGMADEDGVRFGGIERAVGFIDEVEGGQHAAALQLKWLAELRALRSDETDT
jgi:hypothetical protein